MSDRSVDDALLAPIDGGEAEGEASEEEAPQGYLANSRSVFNSLLLATPLFVAYQIGVLFTDGWRNGVDFVTPKLYDLVGSSRGNYLLVNAGILAVLLIAGRLARRPRRLRGRTWLLVLVESTVYASALGAVILWMMNALDIDPRIAIEWAGELVTVPLQTLPEGGVPNLSTLDQLVLSFGAGAYEELVFRLILLSALIWGFRRMGLKTLATLTLAFVLSSLIFAAAHHAPLGQELWALGPFSYRFLAGLVFAALFVGRGFAVAAYTHAFYDVYVLAIA